MSADIIISASILSADFSQLGEEIARVERGGADWIHIDVMDGHFVPNLTMGPVVIQACKQVTDLPLDVHLMVSNADSMLEAYATAGADSLTVHQEACQHLHRTLQRIGELGCKAGVALNPATPISAVYEVVELLDLLLIMSVNPGYSGQKFIKASIDKIAAARKLLTDRGSNALLQVDGGIGPSTAPRVVEAGASVLVAASAIYSHPEGPQVGAEELRRVAQNIQANG